MTLLIITHTLTTHQLSCTGSYVMWCHYKLFKLSTTLYHLISWVTKHMPNYKTCMPKCRQFLHYNKSLPSNSLSRWNQPLTPAIVLLIELVSRQSTLGACNTITTACVAILMSPFLLRLFLLEALVISGSAAWCTVTTIISWVNHYTQPHPHKVCAGVQNTSIHFQFHSRIIFLGFSHHLLQVKLPW